MKHPYSTLPLLLLAAAVQNANAYYHAADDFVTIAQGSGPVTINVLANDTADYGTPELDDYDNYVYLTSPSHGTLVRNPDDTLTYTPEANFIGTDTFSYRGQETSVGYGGTATVTIQVTGAPVTTNDKLALHVTGARNKAVATMLDNVCFSETATAGVTNACNSLYEKIGSGDLDQLVAEIAPDEALTQRQLLAHNGRNTTATVYRSMALLRSETTGATSVSINNVTLPSGGAAGDGFSSPWTLLSSLQVDNLERDLSANEAGYDAKGLSLMLGLGYRLSNNLNLGAALDWTNYDVDYLNKSGTLDADTYSLTSFLSWYKGPFSVEVQAGYTAGQSDAQRRFTFPVAAVADSRYDSSQTTLSTRAEWAWQSGALALKPFIRIDYLDTEIDGYSETGDSLWLMQADKQQQQLTNASIGLDTSYTLSYSWGVLTPNLNLSLVSQDNLNTDPVAFQLINGDSALGRFELQTDKLDTRFYQWELNSVAMLKNGVSAFIAVQTLSDYDNVSSYRISGGFNKEF